MNNVLLNHYQACLDDYTRPAVLHGQCQQGINRWHKLAMVPCKLPGGDLAELVIPERLQRVLTIPRNNATRSVSKSRVLILNRVLRKNSRSSASATIATLARTK